MIGTADSEERPIDLLFALSTGLAMRRQQNLVNKLQSSTKSRTLNYIDDPKSVFVLQIALCIPIDWISQRHRNVRGIRANLVFTAIIVVFAVGVLLSSQAVYRQCAAPRSLLVHLRKRTTKVAPVDQLISLFSGPF